MNSESIARADTPQWRTFLIGCLGQVISLMGSQLTSFAIGVWLYERTRSVTIFSLTLLAGTLPQLLIMPFAGVVVDRWSRRGTMILGHCGSGVCSVLLAILFGSRAPSIAAVLATIAIASCFGALQLPAFAAATTMLVPKAQRGRANGIWQSGIAVAQLVSPVAAGALLNTIGLVGILMIDVSSFAVAILIFLFLRIPDPEVSTAGRQAGGSMLQQVACAFRYLRLRPGLFSLLIFLGFVNFTFGMVEVLITPLVLGFSNAQGLGTIASVSGLGMLLGGGVMVAWGGPRKRIHGVLGFALLQSLLLFCGAARPSAILVAAGAFGVLFTVPMIAGCNQTIWQQKIPADLQGRIFSARTAMVGGAIPLAHIIAGPLADHVFEPLMAPRGPLAQTMGRILGVGSGRGVALLFVVLGCLLALTAIAGFLYPPLLRVEENDLEENSHPITAN